LPSGSGGIAAVGLSWWSRRPNRELLHERCERQIDLALQLRIGRGEVWRVASVTVNGVDLVISRLGGVRGRVDVSRNAKRRGSSSAPACLQCALARRRHQPSTSLTPAPPPLQRPHTHTCRRHDRHRDNQECRRPGRPECVPTPIGLDKRQLNGNANT
jgi:hypothetical protein